MYEKMKYGFWRQTEMAPFDYTEEYEEKQSTNLEMTYLRLGFLGSHIPPATLKLFRAVDVGCGNGCFVDFAKDKFKSLVGYDVVGESIGIEELEKTFWDMVILSDVLEHFNDIEYLFEGLKWRFAFISFPETPAVDDWCELQAWRHFKPDEHLWHLNKDGMLAWMCMDRGCKLVGVSNVEDIIRRPQEGYKKNITSMIVERAH